MNKETYNILDHSTGAVRFTAKIECAANASSNVKLGLAVRAAVKARANLSGAYLSQADLSRANLSGAYLSGAKIKSWVAQLRRSDGHEFIAFDTDQGVKIKAGCRWFTVAEYRAHVAKIYPDTPKATETLAMLDFIQVRADAAIVREEGRQ